MKTFLFFLSNILEVFTPVRVVFVTPPSIPLFWSFGAYQSASSEGFLVFPYSRESEDSILSLDFSPGDSQVGLLGCIITSPGPLETRVEVDETLSLRRRPLTKVRDIGLRQTPSLCSVSEVLERRYGLGTFLRYLPGGSFGLNVMNPAPEDIGILELLLKMVAWETTEILNNGRRVRNRYSFLGKITQVWKKGRIE
jgi:hypothetical protein